MDNRTYHQLRSSTKQDGEVFLDRWGKKLLPAHLQKHIDNTPQRAVLPIDKGREDPEALPPWWWNPGNPLAASLPANVSFVRFSEVRKSLQEVDPKLDITWNGAAHVWQVWYHRPGMLTESPWTNGWVHLKDFKPWQGTPHIVQTIKAMDQATKSIKDHYKKVQAQRESAKAKRRLNFIDDVKHKAGEVFDHFRISNIGKGSKFVNHHA